MTNDHIDSNHNEQEGKSGKSTSYFKVMSIFTIVMAALLLGLNYLFKHLL